MTAFDFTHAGYRRLLRYVQDGLGRPLGPLRAAPQAGPFVILRHDVDFSLRKAVEMARMDADEGARSTFFVLLTAPYYNPLSGEGAALLREIAGMGHEVGLHYDCTGFEAMDTGARRRRVALLAAALGDALGAEVTSIAQHKPASSGVRETFPAFRDAYEPRWIEPGYITDSRQRWGQDDPEGYLRGHPRCQVLVHPVWWHAGPTDRAGSFAAVAEDGAAQVRGLLADEAAHIDRWVRARAQAADAA